MTSKAAKPVITGQRLKSRKRDLKEKYEPEAFRDELVKGLIEAGGDIEKASKFLEDNANPLDFRRYAETLFDILIGGGMFAPGGTLIEDDAPISPICFFAPDSTEERIKAIAEMIRGLLRRYKYLAVSLEEELGKVLRFLKAFDEAQVVKMAQATASLLAFGVTTAKPLESLLAEPLTRGGLSLSFITTMFQSWLRQTPIASVGATLRKADLHGRIVEFLPATRRTPEAFAEHCKAAGGLDDLVAWFSEQASAQVKKTLSAKLLEMLEQGAPVDRLVAVALEEKARLAISDAEMPELVWEAIMAAPDWNKKAEMVPEQAVRHLSANVKLLRAAAPTEATQVELLVAMQNYCYDNQTFLKFFDKLVMLMYKADVMDEEAILRWFTKGHSAKGKSVVLPMMQKMIDWLKSAEEESEEEEEDEAEAPAAAAAAGKGKAAPKAAAASAAAAAADEEEEEEEDDE